MTTDNQHLAQYDEVEKFAATVLIVDDNPTNIQVLMEALGQLGYERLVALDGESAIQLALSARPDLILMDVMLPGIDGYETCKQLKANLKTQSIPIIFMTTLTATKSKIQGFGAGAVDYVTIPLQQEEVLARVGTQLRLHHLQRELHRVADALSQSKERFELAVLGAKDGIWDWDLVQQHIYYSPRWISILGYDERELSNSPREWLDRLHPRDREEFKCRFDAHIQGDTPFFEYEYRIRACAEDYVWVLTRGIALRDASGKAYRVSGSQTDITHGKVIDVLTGLPNRLMFIEHLERCMPHSVAAESAPIAVFIIDLQRFKLVNNSFGQSLGDHLLTAVAARIEGCLQDYLQQYNCINALCARLGSDRFAVSIQCAADAHELTGFCQSLLEYFESPFSLEDQPVFLSFRMGIFYGNANIKRAEDMLREAEIALHHAKAGTSQRWVIFDADMESLMIHRQTLESDLWHALKYQQETGGGAASRNELRLLYQPIISLQSNSIDSCEALLRWQHPSKGSVSPAEFIPIAEETGAILALGEWVIHQACRQYQLWIKAGLPAPQIAVNVSMLQLQKKNFPQQLASILAAHAVSPSAIKIEITESLAMQDIEFTQAALTRIRQMGIKIAMDDFGTGYSSLSYLARLPLDYLKIDRAFIGDLTNDSMAAALVSAMLGMAQSLNLAVIAEGVETVPQLEFLRAHHCQQIQGYLASPPLEPEKFSELLQSGIEF